MKVEWNNPKKKAWFLNILTYNLCRLVPRRDKRLWVFGAWEGMKYDDNARVLFEYVNEHNRDIRCVWLTNKQQTADAVTSLGYEAYVSDSSAGKKIQMKAGVAIYTNGLVDFGLHPRIAGSFIVSLWHGVGFKKIYNAKYSGISLRLKKILDHFFSWTSRDLSLVPSNYVAKQCFDYFTLPSDAKIVITGQPRNDVLKKNKLRAKTLSRLGVSEDKKIILYMPTYRGLALPHDQMLKIIKGLYNSTSLQGTLERNNCIFVAKLHPLTPYVSVENRDDFILLHNNSIDSSQELLATADILVTDYSSCITDFALLEKPIVFYMPDHDDFVKKSEPIYEDFYNICNMNRCDSPEELAKKISCPSLDAVSALNDLFEDPSIKGTCYSENAYKAIMKEIGL